MKKIALFCIRCYQICIAPFIGSVCRFTPSCSHYTYEAIKMHGALKGSWKGFKRICKCNPWNQGGHDPLSRS